MTLFALKQLLAGAFLFQSSVSSFCVHGPRLQEMTAEGHGGKDRRQEFSGNRLPVSWALALLPACHCPGLVGVGMGVGVEWG